jgi:hypothetical protein
MMTPTVSPMIASEMIEHTISFMISTEVRVGKILPHSCPSWRFDRLLDANPTYAGGRPGARRQTHVNLCMSFCLFARIGNPHDRDYQVVLLEDCCAAHSAEEQINSVNSLRRF